MDWLYLHFPHLYGETWLPDFAGHEAIAIVESQGGQQLIVDINAAAKTRGVDVGMALNTAFCLCPQLRVTIMETHKQIQALQRLARFACHYSAWVGLDEPDGLYLEIASMRKLFGEAKCLQRRLQQALQQKHITATIAAAPRAKAARLLARAGQGRCYSQSQLLRHLTDIPITALDIGPKTEVRLMKLGLRHVHDLIQLPSSDLSYRIDAALALYLDQVLGHRRWLPTPFTLPERFRWTLDLEQEFESLEPLRFFLAKGVQQFSAFLQTRSLAARELQLLLRHRQREPSLIDVKLASLDNRVESWQYMLNAVINRIDLAAPVNGLGLAAARFETLNDQTPRLFKRLSQECSQKKAHLLNRLSARLGLDSLRFLQFTDDPRPEKQTLFTRQPAKALPDYTPGANTPLCLLAQPQPIDQAQYCLYRGPTRLATGWWDRDAVHRDYYVASDKYFSSQWLFLTASGQWYRQGWFA